MAPWFYKMNWLIVMAIFAYHPETILMDRNWNVLIIDKIESASAQEEHWISFITMNNKSYSNSSEEV